jgi:hypothetical protein
VNELVDNEQTKQFDVLLGVVYFSFFLNDGFGLYLSFVLLMLYFYLLLAPPTKFAKINNDNNNNNNNNNNNI